MSAARDRAIARVGERTTKQLATLNGLRIEYGR
jgi:hypothetical protein